MSKIKNTLEYTSYLAIIVVCTVVLFKLNASGSSSPDSLSIQIGDRSDDLKSLVAQGSDETILIALSPTCPFCADSMPFYKDLIESRNNSNSNQKIIIAVDKSAPIEEELLLLTKSNVSPDEITQLDFAAIKVNSVPTLITINRKGKVTNHYRGLLNEQEQKEALAAIIKP